MQAEAIRGGNELLMGFNVGGTTQGGGRRKMDEGGKEEGRLRKGRLREGGRRKMDEGGKE